jgi:hypothetical protein
LAMKRLSNIAANNCKAEEISEIFKHLTWLVWTFRHRRHSWITTERRDWKQESDLGRKWNKALHRITEPNPWFSKNVQISEVTYRNTNCDSVTIKNQH